MRKDHETIDTPTSMGFREAIVYGLGELLNRRRGLQSRRTLESGGNLSVDSMPETRCVDISPSLQNAASSLVRTQLKAETQKADREVDVVDENDRFYTSKWSRLFPSLKVEKEDIELRTR
jgi:hypothetical protein